MKKLILRILFITAIVSGTSAVRAQTLQTRNLSCQPTAEEILSIVKTVYNWAPSADGVLLTGELSVTGELEMSEKQLSLTRLLAMIGGVSKTSNGTIYVIRQTGKNGTNIKFEIDLNAVKQGRASDLMLEKGDLVFAPRNCANGKLMMPSKPANPLKLLKQKSPPGTDVPKNMNNKRNSV
jgi:hypothetical protein